ncbi:MAG: hypothetical protein KAT00_05775 [Planctomycetes bacterium]|nr:hypothetical protein [Planctomycetota bacterium]
MGAQPGTRTPDKFNGIEMLRAAFNSQGKLEVQLSDQTTPTVIVPLNQVANETTLLSGATIEESTVDVSATAGFVDGTFIVIANADENRYYTGKQVGAIAGNTVTLDTPLDFSYPAGTEITNGSTDLSVLGTLASPEIFSLRASDPGLPTVVDVTRIIFTCITDTAVDLTKFGDIIGGLTNGIVLRRRDGFINNIFNAKNNGELSSLMYDFQVAAATNPNQGQDGFVGRLTFAGQNKIGVTIRIGPDEDLEILVQDDLSTLLDFQIVVEGHVVLD